MHDDAGYLAQARRRLRYAVEDLDEGETLVGRPHFGTRYACYLCGSPCMSTAVSRRRSPCLFAAKECTGFPSSLTVRRSVPVLIAAAGPYLIALDAGILTPNFIPESGKDRPTHSHAYRFLLTKNGT